MYIYIYIMLSTREPPQPKVFLLPGGLWEASLYFSHTPIFTELLHAEVFLELLHRCS